jgi:hypothetical protein
MSVPQAGRLAIVLEAGRLEPEMTGQYQYRALAI